MTDAENAGGTIEVSDASFSAEVLSSNKPVLVDFWATWCGPCKMVAPVLEEIATERAEQLTVAKLDVDANPVVARTYGIQSIPAVKAFRDGRVVAEFVGAQPPTAVNSFLDSLLPSETDGLVAQGDEESLRRAVELEPSRADAAVPLARILHERGDDDAALALLREVPGSFAADGLAARIGLERDDHGLDLHEALSALDAGDHERALDLLIAALPVVIGGKTSVLISISHRGVASPLWERLP